VNNINIMNVQSQGTLFTSKRQQKTRNRNINVLIEISLTIK